eukprot:Rhum_TRINITY_DN23034_c0_g2::Rhum_TRINITY_DN23034_c0_g2_i1::g.176769::m.176769
MYRLAVVACIGGATLAAPPRHMPEDLKDGYTMGGRIPIGEFFVDDTGEEGTGTHYRYKKANIEGFVQSASRNKGRKINLARENKRMWILQALNEVPLKEKARGAVYGSMEPWYEAVALAYGASEVTTIEYNKLTYEWPGMKTITVAECEEPERQSECLGFDFGFSISSFDHDGLGRYGDPLDPDGDVKAMKKTLSQLAPGGILYLTLPVGPDVVVWNLHRRYGPLRLPLMLEGWEVVARIGWDEAKLTEEKDWRMSYEPVLVLRKPIEGEAAAQPSAEEL